MPLLGYLLPRLTVLRLDVDLCGVNVDVQAGPGGLLVDLTPLSQLHRSSDTEPDAPAYGFAPPTPDREAQPS